MTSERLWRTDVIQVAYNEANADFTESYRIAAELVPDLTIKELTEYQRIGEEIDAFHVEQREQQRLMIELGRTASNAEQTFEYVGRLLAVVERNTERLHHLTEQLSNFVRSHFAR
jgi:hypothetical protein